MILSNTDRSIYPGQGLSLSLSTGHLGRFFIGDKMVQKRKKWNDPHVYVKALEHPNSTDWGYLREHILIAEEVLGKHLPANAVVHHWKGYGKGNRNLVICENPSYHMLLHARETAYRETGNPKSRKCQHCHQYDDIKNLFSTKHPGHHYHLKCENKYRRNLYKKNKLSQAWCRKIAECKPAQEAIKK